MLVNLGKDKAPVPNGFALHFGSRIGRLLRRSQKDMQDIKGFRPFGQECGRVAPKAVSLGVDWTY